MKIRQCSNNEIVCTLTHEESLILRDLGQAYSSLEKITFDLEDSIILYNMVDSINEVIGNPYDQKRDDKS